MKLIIDSVNENKNYIEYILNYKGKNIFNLKSKEDIDEIIPLIKIKYRYQLSGHSHPKNRNSASMEDLFSI